MSSVLTPVAPSNPDVVRREKNKTKTLLFSLLALIVIVVGGITAIWAYNEVTLQKPLQRVLLADNRNHVVKVSAHFDGWVDMQTVVFDLSEVSGQASQADIFRVFLQYAQALKDRQFGKVVLAAFGQKKFVISGDYFQQLGIDFDSQNPIYTIRTFPHHVSTIDGAKPFPEPEGGLFYVLGEEMKQVNDLNKRWYLDEFVARTK